MCMQLTQCCSQVSQPGAGAGEFSGREQVSCLPRLRKRLSEKQKTDKQETDETQGPGTRSVSLCLWLTSRTLAHSMMQSLEMKKLTLFFFLFWGDA